MRVKVSGSVLPERARWSSHSKTTLGPRNGMPPGACRSDTQLTQRGGAKSFVDDLGLSRGVVLSRAAASLRSVETKPYDWQICPLQTGASAAVGPLAPSSLVGEGSGGARLVFLSKSNSREGQPKSVPNPPTRGCGVCWGTKSNTPRQWGLMGTDSQEVRLALRGGGRVPPGPCHLSVPTSVGGRVGGGGGAVPGLPLFLFRLKVGFLPALDRTVFTRA